MQGITQSSYISVLNNTPQILFFSEAMESEKYYTKTMELFDNYKVGVEQVGTPYKAKRLFIQDTERNWTDRMNARVSTLHNSFPNLHCNVYIKP